MKTIIVALAAVVAVITSTASSGEAKKGLRLEAGYGKCRGSGPDEGTWQQTGSTHQLQLSDKCGEVGVLWSVAHDVSFGARFINFGQFASYAIANNDPQDLQALRGTVSTDHTRAECQQRNPKAGPGQAPMLDDCNYRWNGSGHLWGGLFTAAWHPLHFGELRLGGELGWVVYKATWRVIVQPPENPSWEYQYDQRTGWRKSPEFGVSAYYKYAYVAYRIYMIPDGAPITPGYRSPVRQFVLGVSVPLDF